MNDDCGPEWPGDEWAAFVSQGRARLRLSRRELALQVGVDPSAVTLWINGHIPRRATVHRVGILFCDLPGAYAAAGYVLSKAQAQSWWRSQMRALSESSITLLGFLSGLTHHQQDELTKQLRVYLTQRVRGRTA